MTTIDLANDEVNVVRSALNAYWGPRQASVRAYDLGDPPQGLSDETIERWRAEASLASSVLVRLP